MKLIQITAGPTAQGHVLYAISDTGNVFWWNGIVSEWIAMPMNIAPPHKQAAPPQ